MNQSTPLPGWYPDPEGGIGQRYWNGSVWGQRAAVAPPAAPPPSPPKSRRWIWIAVTAVIGLFALTSQCSNTDKTGSESAPSSTQTSSAAAPPPPPPPPPTTSTAQLPTPKYTVIGERERFDDQPIYYVLIDPVDLSTDEFKNSVKGVLQALTAKQGNPNFSAWFYDNREIGQLAYADQVTPPVMDSPEEIKAKASATEPHLIATYSGGNPNAGTMYGIMWFPGGTRSSPTIGQWVGNEEFKP